MRSVMKLLKNCNFLFSFGADVKTRVSIHFLRVYIA